EAVWLVLAGLTLTAVAFRFVLLFKPSAHALDLPSSPTRRSSDLVYRGDALIPGADGAIAALRAAGRRVAFLSNKPLQTRRPEGRDRKSTRLNSSHEWSSYAVFCLQKKTDNRQALVQA